MWVVEWWHHELSFPLLRVSSMTCAVPPRSTSIWSAEHWNPASLRAFWMLIPVEHTSSQTPANQLSACLLAWANINDAYIILCVEVLLQGDVYRCLGLWWKRSEMVTSALANYTLSTSGIRAERFQQVSFCMVEWALVFRKRATCWCQTNVRPGWALSWQVDGCCDICWGSESGLDDQCFKVYFDLMLVEYGGLPCTFRTLWAFCVHNLQSIIQLRLISYSVGLCNNTLPWSTRFDLTPGKSCRSGFFSLMTKTDKNPRFSRLWKSLYFAFWFCCLYYSRNMV